MIKASRPAILLAGEQSLFQLVIAAQNMILDQWFADFCAIISEWSRAWRVSYLTVCDVHSTCGLQYDLLPGAASEEIPAGNRCFSDCKHALLQISMKKFLL